jgi:hypothetical protein
MTLPSLPACNLCSATSSHPFLVNGDYTIRQYSRCGLRYLDPQPTAAQLDDLYSHDYFGSEESVHTGYANYAAEVDNHRATFDNRLRFLPQATNGQRLLDVGAATGFVERARARGWEAEGVEPSAWAAAFARDTLQQPVQMTTLEQAGFPDAHATAEHTTRIHSATG